MILVHGGSTVVSDMGYGIPAAATKTLQDYGIELFLNDKVQQYFPEKGCVELKSGKTVPCDYYLPAFSSRQGNCKFLPPASQDSAGAGTNTSSLCDCHHIPYQHRCTRTRLSPILSAHPSTHPTVTPYQQPIPQPTLLTHFSTHSH